MGKKIYLSFKSEMIRAYQAGLKTQTRRVIMSDWRLSQRDRPLAMPLSGVMVYHDGMAFEADDLAKWKSSPGQLLPYPLASRLGRAGDTLVIREPLVKANGDQIQYAADGVIIAGHWPWRKARLPAMYMPFLLARYTPKITAVRVERLQEITDRDAEAEGVNFARREVTWYRGKWRDGFIELWDRIHHATGYGWATNPWVVVREFERFQAT